MAHRMAPTPYCIYDGDIEPGRPRLLRRARTTSLAATVQQMTYR